MPDDMPTTRTDNGEPVKYVPISEFWAKGYVMEINRRFLHPLGMALEVCEDKDGVPRLGGIQDYRADPEGMIFGELLNHDDTIRVLLINEEWDFRKAARMAALGWMIEPLPNPVAETLADIRNPCTGCAHEAHPGVECTLPGMNGQTCGCRDNVPG